MRVGMLIPHFGWCIPSYYSCAGEWMAWFCYWTYWGWYASILSVIFSILAARNPEYWHVTAHVFTEVAHALNMLIMIGVWCVLLPLSIISGQMGLADEYFGTRSLAAWNRGETEVNFGFGPDKPWWYLDIATYMLVTNLILHLTPWLMVLANIYFTDIKLMKLDWKLHIFHCPIYVFMNYVGNCYQQLTYPLIDWVSTPMTLFLFSLCGAVMCTCYYYNCQWHDSCLKRRNEK